eukprot:3586846-Alexandrium_andersonii.AAC.1
MGCRAGKDEPRRKMRTSSSTHSSRAGDKPKLALWLLCGCSWVLLLGLLLGVVLGPWGASGVLLCCSWGVALGCSWGMLF